MNIESFLVGVVVQNLGLESLLDNFRKQVLFLLLPLALLGFCQWSLLNDIFICRIELFGFDHSFSLTLTKFSNGLLFYKRPTDLFFL